MSNIIKYKRFKFKGNDRELQLFFDDLVKDGYIIHTYQELEVNLKKIEDNIHCIIICYKENNIKNILND
jgi:hypothetical protein